MNNDARRVHNKAFGPLTTKWRMNTDTGGSSFLIEPSQIPVTPVDYLPPPPQGEEVSSSEDEIAVLSKQRWEEASDFTNSLEKVLSKIREAETEDEADEPLEHLEEVWKGALLPADTLLGLVSSPEESEMFRSRILSTLGRLPLQPAVLGEFLLAGERLVLDPSATVRYGLADALVALTESETLSPRRWHRRRLKRLARVLACDHIPAVRNVASQIDTGDD